MPEARFEVAGMRPSEADQLLRFEGFANERCRALEPLEPQLPALSLLGGRKPLPLVARVHRVHAESLACGAPLQDSQTLALCRLRPCTPSARPQPSATFCSTSAASTLEAPSKSLTCLTCHSWRPGCCVFAPHRLRQPRQRCCLLPPLTSSLFRSRLQ